MFVNNSMYNSQLKSNKSNICTEAVSNSHVRALELQSRLSKARIASYWLCNLDALTAVQEIS